MYSLKDYNNYKQIKIFSSTFLIETNIKSYFSRFFNSYSLLSTKQKKSIVSNYSFLDKENFLISLQLLLWRWTKRSIGYIGN